MKKYAKFIPFILFALNIPCPLNAQIGTWTKVANFAPHPNMGVMLLLTDGTVICHNTRGGGEGTDWDKLTPDSAGSYVHGTWTSISSMTNDRLFFSSQVLPSGKVYVAGGEYGAGTSSGEVYDPSTNAWTACGAIPGGWKIYDGNSEILYNGNVLEGPQIGSQDSYNILQWSPATLNFTTDSNAPLNHDEAAWLKLPDSSVLYIGINSQKSCRYIAKAGTWVNDANVPNNIYDQWGEESGCALMLPNGKAIFFGSTQYNDIYTPSGNASPGTWTAAANFPSINGAVVGQVDAPGAMMVNGHILLAVSPGNTSANDQFRDPVYFLEYNYVTDSFAQVTSIIPGLAADSIAGVTSNFANFLDLPDGTVLMGIDQEPISREYWIYTPGSGPIPQGIPTINNIIPDGCPNYKITGKLFNGISEGAAFGDDWQESTNYPLVRLTDGIHVYYAKTSNWNRIGAVQTDSLEDTAIFTLPAGLTPGKTYSLVVVANGFASNPTLFTPLGITTLTNTNTACNGNTGSATANTISGGISPYTYLWTPGGNTTMALTGLSAGTYSITVTDNNGCSATSSVIIHQQSSSIVITKDSVNVDSVGGTCNGSATLGLSGGAAPYTYSWSPGGGSKDSITGKCPGQYCCTITDHNGCTESTCVTIGNVTGIANINNPAAISIYPNPSNGIFTFVIAGGANPVIASGAKQSLIEIYNALGEKVYSQLSTFNSQLSINLANQPDGVYLYRIIAENGELIREGKMIIAR